VLHAHQVPGAQLLEPHADVGARKIERGGDFVGIERALADEQQGINLADGAVDAPAAAHFAKVQHEALGEFRELHKWLIEVSGISESRRNCLT
jgi:hypothetical protein